MRMASMRESRDSDRQHTSTITCTAALRVWHFSAFHCVISRNERYPVKFTKGQLNSDIRTAHQGRGHKFPKIRPFEQMLFNPQFLRKYFSVFSVF